MEGRIDWDDLLECRNKYNSTGDISFDIGYRF